MATEVIEQLVVVGFELGQSALPLQRLSLTELHDQGRRSGGLELPLPRTEVQVAPLLVDGIRLPGHRTEDRVLTGKGRGEP